MLFEAIIKDVVDAGLLTAQSYLLIRSCGTLSVVGYIIELRIPLTEDLAWIFKIGFILNSFGSVASTIGKFYIVLHRYVVIRRAGLVEEIWSSRVTVMLITIAIFASAVRCIPYLFCDYAYATIDGLKIVTFFDDECVIADKIVASIIYFTHSIVVIALTMLTSRDLIRLSLNTEAETRNIIFLQQRNMFIIVASCTFFQLVKAIYQLSWVFIALFRLTTWSIFIRDIYAYPHYAATYVTSITLVMFSIKVRHLLIRRDDMQSNSVVSISMAHLR